MKPTNYSIEFCHIYLNETFSHEHEKSIAIAKEQIEKFDSEVTYSLNVLIDDYNATETVLDILEMKAHLAEEGVKPDYLAYEARLASYAPTVLAQMKAGKVKKSYERYIDGNGGFVPCSFLIATWYMMRLGLIDQDQDHLVYDRNGGHSKSFVGEKLISILPERFRGVEAKASKILEATPFSGKLEDIERIYFDGVLERIA